MASQSGTAQYFLKNVKSFNNNIIKLHCAFPSPFHTPKEEVATAATSTTDKLRFDEQSHIAQYPLITFNLTWVYQSHNGQFLLSKTIVEA
jgi:hypothetical protein